MLATITDIVFHANKIVCRVRYNEGSNRGQVAIHEFDNSFLTRNSLAKITRHFMYVTEDYFDIDVPILIWTKTLEDGTIFEKGFSDRHRHNLVWFQQVWTAID